MSIPTAERDMLRRLASEIAEIAALPVHEEKRTLWRKLNRLDSARPLVWINEICWEQMGDVVQPQATDPLLRGIEGRMRRTLYQWRNLPADMIVDGWIACPIAVSDTGYGLQQKTAHTSDEGFVKSAVDFIPIITCEADVEKIQMPEVSVDWDETERRFALLDGIFGDILPVRKQGVAHTWFAPWDTLVRWYGIQEMYVDMVDRPDLVKLAIDRTVSAMLHKYEQYERLGVLALNNGNNRVGSGGLGMSDELPQADFDGERVRMMDMWGNSTPQIFSGVSPDMHWEFALQYEMRILERFGLNCYGCCEPLHRKIDILRRVPRLRRISMSPFVDIAVGAEAIGQDFIYSAKPNPAVLAGERWHPDAARADLREILDKTEGLHVEIVLKDVHTLRGEPHRLSEWSHIAMEMAEA
ncbi:hypothetical protein HQ560_08595 [bacterium]|nr:hypothetical protein [bacterium]